MKIKTANTEFPVVKIISEAMKKGVYTYPALKIVLPDSIPAEYVSEILSGKFDIIDDMGNVAMTYEGYKTLKEISITVGRITTADERVEELEEELTEVQAEHTEYKETVKEILPTLDDKTALTVVSLFPTWEECVAAYSVESPEGFRFSYNGELYRCKSANPTFQENWIPGEGTESMYERIETEHEGTVDDPIPYSGNMELFSGKYYVQDSIVYLCNRDTGTAVYNPLSDLIGIYVETV